MLACLSGLAVLRARSLTRKLNRAVRPAYRPPIEDLAAATGLPLPTLTPTKVLALVAPVAAVGAALRDHLEHATLAQASTTGAVEAMAVVAGFVLLGGTLGIGPKRSRAA